MEVSPSADHQPENRLITTTPNATSAGPQVHHHDRAPLRVPDLEQPVVQVLLVRREGRPPGPGAADDRQHQVDERHDAAPRSAGSAGAAPAAGWRCAPRALGRASVGENRPVRLIAEHASMKPISIEPESPMNIRAG